MVPSNILQRTFRVQYGQQTGTCFTIEVDSKQYIVTARHVLEGIHQNDTLHLQHERQWKEFPVSLVGVGNGDVDIAVVAARHVLSPTHQLIPTTQDLYLSQDIYFLGFPYGLQIELVS